MAATTSTTISTPSIAFFGATGGCANAALVLALNNGYACTALARTPTKLRAMLTEKGVSAADQTRLVIVQGDARDPAAVRAALAPASAPAADSCISAPYAYDASRAVPLVVSGIGMTLALGAKMDGTICRDFAATLVQAVTEAQPPLKQAPFVACVSTTGISEGKRDVPLLFVPLYHVALKVPHADKRIMEKTLRTAGEDGTFAGCCIARASLLTNGAEHNAGDIRVGSEDNPAVGYTISRLDVGRWIYEEIIKGDEGKWRGAAPTLTA